MPSHQYDEVILPARFPHQYSLSCVSEKRRIREGSHQEKMVEFRKKSLIGGGGGGGRGSGVLIFLVFFGNIFLY